MNGSEQQGTIQRLRASGNTLRGTVAFAAAHLLLSAICLVRWHSSDHWSGFDIFSGSYLALKSLGSIQSLYSGRKAFQSETLKGEWWGTTSDASIVRATRLLMLADLLIFFDYAHWQTLRWLELPGIQFVGLALYVLAKIWQMWTDSYLEAYFTGAKSPQSQSVMNQGPFRFIRHPRYAGVIAGKVGCALIFASVFGWLLALVWTAVYTRKVRREETHMCKLLGESYKEYSRKTARLIPGIY